MNNKKAEENLDQEIEEMEKSLFTDHSDDEESDEPEGEELEATEEPAEEIEAEAEVVDEPQEDLQEPEPESEEKPRKTAPKYGTKAYWEERAKSTKTKLDTTIHSLRVDNANQATRIATLSDELNRLRQETAKLQAEAAKKSEGTLDGFTQEEKDVLGDEALLALKRVTQEQVANATRPLQDQLARSAAATQAEIKAQALKASQASLDSFKVLVREQVPNMDAIDLDPNFVTWLNKPGFGGVPRHTLLKKAQGTGDVERVAQFFQAYETEVLSKKNKIEAQISPEGTGSSPKPREQLSRKWTWKSIDEYYNNVAKGKYKGKEKLAEQLETEIDAIVMRATAGEVQIPRR